MAEPHVAGDEALRCRTLCLQSSPALLACPSSQYWGARRFPPAWWALPISWLWWPPAESSSSHASWAKVMGARGATRVVMGRLAKGTAGADAPQNDPGALSQHLMSGNGSALL